jgi:hypothetical protein
MSFKDGLTKGVMMSDDECLRFANGMIAAILGCPVRPMHMPNEARASIPGLMDMLADCGMVATIGYNGTPIIWFIGLPIIWEHGKDPATQFAPGKHV